MPAVPPTTTRLGLPRFAADQSVAGMPAALNSITDGVDALFGPWSTYSPVWKQADGSTLSIGSGTLEGRYQWMGKTLRGVIRLVRAADTNVGTADQPWNFSLPPATPRNWNDVGGAMAMIRGGLWYGGVVFPTSSTTIGVIVGSARVETGSPVGGHNVGDWMTIRFEYETA